MLIKKYGTKIAFILILLITIFLRFYDLPKTMQWWDGDAAEDAVYAYHITKFNEEIYTGRSPVGGKGLIAKSPLIYYFFSLAWLFSDSPVGYGVIYALINVLLVVFVYLLAKCFVNEKASLGLMLMISLSWCFSYVSRQTFSHASILIGWLPLVIYFLWKSLNKRSWGYLFIFIATLFGGLHIHHSILSIFPVLVLWGVISYKRIYKKTNKFRRIILGLFVLLMLVLWLGMTTKLSGFYEQYKVLSLVTNGGVEMNQWLVNCWEILLTSSREMFKNESQLLAGVFFAIVYFGLIILGIYDYKKKRGQDLFKTTFLGSLITSVFVAAWMGGVESVERFYVVIYYPLWLLAFVYVIWRWKIWIGWIVLIFYLLAGTGILADKSQGLFWPRYSGGLIEAEMVAKEILADAKNRTENDNFKIVFYNFYTQNEFGKAIFWYLIEREMGREMLNIKQYPPFSIYLEEKYPSKVIYLVCTNKPKWGNYDKCQEIYKKNNPEKNFIEVVKIKEDKEGEWPYVLFRFKEV